MDEWTEKVNTPDFIKDDPVQFPRRFLESGCLPDIEITSFVVSSITWGKRGMILKSAERLLSKLGDSPYDYVMNRGYETLGQSNVHRTFFEPDLAYMLRGFKRIYDSHPSLQHFLQTSFNGTISYITAWDICRALQIEMETANRTINRKCFPCHFEHSALKRFNLALRWLVRNDGIVDLGVWSLLKPSQLHIPLDVHVGNVARQTGLLTRKTNDRKAVEQLTGTLRAFCPDDPIKYDFALFGIGISNKK